jgi:threonine/homoserine/homoserine lactone efflux protein
VVIITVAVAFFKRSRTDYSSKSIVIPLHQWLIFAGTAFLLALSPGPNMFYLVSRSICQGPMAGVVSLFGVITGMAIYMLLTAFGLSAVFVAVPLVYDTIKFAGAAYLLWLAWQAIRPGSRSLFEARQLAPDSRRKLFSTGLITCLLNPKVMVFYASLLPQFVDPQRGSVLAQSLLLGATQITMACTAHLGVILSAGGMARVLSRHPRWLSMQRYVMASVLSALAVRLAFEHKKSA